MRAWKGLARLDAQPLTTYVAKSPHLPVTRMSALWSSHGASGFSSKSFWRRHRRNRRCLIDRAIDLGDCRGRL